MHKQEIEKLIGFINNLDISQEMKDHYISALGQENIDQEILEEINFLISEEIENIKYEQEVNDREIVDLKEQLEIEQKKNAPEKAKLQKSFREKLKELYQNAVRKFNEFVWGLEKKAEETKKSEEQNEIDAIRKWLSVKSSNN